MRRELAPGIELDDDLARVDVAEVHRFQEDGRQAGLARAVSDGGITPPT